MHVFSPVIYFEVYNLCFMGLGIKGQYHRNLYPKHFAVKKKKKKESTSYASYNIYDFFFSLMFSFRLEICCQKLTSL